MLHGRSIQFVSYVYAYMSAREAGDRDSFRAGVTAKYRMSIPMTLIDEKIGEEGRRPFKKDDVSFQQYLKQIFVTL